MSRSLRCSVWHDVLCDTWRHLDRVHKQSAKTSVSHPSIGLSKHRGIWKKTCGATTVFFGCYCLYVFDGWTLLVYQVRLLGLPPANTVNASLEHTNHSSILNPQEIDSLVRADDDECLESTAMCSFLNVLISILSLLHFLSSVQMQDLCMITNNQCKHKHIPIFLCNRTPSTPTMRKAWKPHSAPDQKRRMLHFACHCSSKLKHK